MNLTAQYNPQDGCLVMKAPVRRRTREVFPSSSPSCTQTGNGSFSCTSPPPVQNIPEPVIFGGHNSAIPPSPLIPQYGVATDKLRAQHGDKHAQARLAVLAHLPAAPMSCEEFADQTRPTYLISNPFHDERSDDILGAVAPSKRGPVIDITQDEIEGRYAVPLDVDEEQIRAIAEDTKRKLRQLNQYAGGGGGDPHFREGGDMPYVHISTQPSKVWMYNQQ